MTRTWTIEDHLCRGCGGRILKCATNTGMSPGGNPLWKCPDCGATEWSGSPDALCWCGMNQKFQSFPAYRCLPFTILKEKPYLESDFRACGCDPSKGEVGIVLMAALAKEVQS